MIFVLTGLLRVLDKYERCFLQGILGSKLSTAICSVAAVLLENRAVPAQAKWAVLADQ